MKEQIEAEILIEARRGIDAQRDSIDELRSRTGLLLAAASVSVSVLATTATASGNGLNGWGYAALCCFVFAVILSIWVLLPGRWTLATSPKVLTEDWLNFDRPDESLPVFLAGSLEENYDKNAEKLDGLLRKFQFAAIAVGAEVILLALQVAD